MDFKKASIIFILVLFVIIGLYVYQLNDKSTPSSSARLILCSGLSSDCEDVDSNSLSYLTDTELRQWFYFQEVGINNGWPGINETDPLENLTEGSHQLTQDQFEAHQEYAEKASKSYKAWEKAYFGEYDNFKNTTPLVDRHLLKILSEDSFFKSILPEPKIYIPRSRISNESIESTYQEPDIINARNEVPVGYERKVLLKEKPQSDTILKASVLTKNEANGRYCFSQEGYEMLIDMIAKKVIYISHS